MYPWRAVLKNYDRLCWVLPARNKLKDKTSEPGYVLVPFLPRALGRKIWLLGSSAAGCPTCLQARSYLDPCSQSESPYWYLWLSWSYIRVVHNKDRARPHEGNHSLSEHSCLAHTTEAFFSLQLSSFFFFFTINLISFSFVFACIYVCVFSGFLCLEPTETIKGHRIP